jgi:polar amino acid transport system substrate-binding protein
MDSVDSAYAVFVKDKLEVLAGLRPKLIEQQTQLTGSVILDESFTAVQQSIGCAPGKPAATQYINEKIKQWITNGFIQQLIDKHGVTGKLSVATVEG